MEPYYQDDSAKIYNGNCLSVLRDLPDELVQMCVTSPPYWGLRDYKNDDQLGQEKTPEEYVKNLVEVFKEVKRVLKNDGTLWLNLGDCFYGSWENYGGGNRGAGKQRLIKSGSHATNPVWEGLEGFRPPAIQKHPSLKPKDLVGIPWRVAFALQADGWFLRQEIIWSKPNPMPESVLDRPTRSHEQIFLLSKQQKYFYNSNAIKEPATYSTEARKGRAKEGDKGYPTSERNGIRKSKKQNVGVESDITRNKRSVWSVATRPFAEAHFAVFPPELIKPCILAGSKEGEVVLDPFSGAGTTALVSKERNRKSIGIELNCNYIEIAKGRLCQEVLSLVEGG